MSLEADLWTLLTSAPAVYARCGNRVYPVLIPQDIVTPALAYQLISAPGQYTHDQGDIGLIRARMQLTAQAETYDALHALVRAVRAALTGYKGTVGTTELQALFIDSERHEWADTFVRPTGRLDVIIWYREVV